jgi:hypothetical protein
MPREKDEVYSDKETERRATEALRSALSTPYKPHSEMVGKSQPTRKPRPGREIQAKRSER